MVSEARLFSYKDLKMAIDINLNVNPADDGNPYNDYNKKEAQAHIDKLINEQVSDEQLEAFLESKRDQVAADNAKFIQEQQEAMEEALQKFAEEQKSKQGYDDLLSAPDITPEQSSQLKFSVGSGTGDLVFQQRIENLDRTINSKEFRNAAVQLNPYFDSLRSKASRLDNPDDLMPLVDRENEKQLANINDIETTMYNAIDMMFAQTQMKMRSLEASMEEGSSLTEDPRYNELLDFQSQLNSMRDNVSSYIGESVDRLQTESTKFAIAGFDEGDTERKIAEGMKEQKRVEKLVADFNKEFDAYIDKQKEEVAKGYAFSMAQGYLNSNRDATMQNARRVYANAFKDFQDNVPVAGHGLTDEEIANLYAASGGKVDIAGQAPKINVPQNFQGNGPTPPNYLDAPNNNMSSLQSNGGGSGSGKVPIHMIMSEVTSAIIEPILAIRAALVGFAVPDLKNYMKATTAQRINPNEYIESIGEKTGRAATAVGRTGGSAIGFALGGLPGAFAGSRIGETLADIIPIEEFAQMVSYLYQIADNTSKQAMAFSPELMQANVDRQLAFLEENIAVGESVGAELAELYDAGTQFQLTFYREALEIVRPLLPLMVQVVNLLTNLVGIVSAGISGIIEYFITGSFAAAVAAAVTNYNNANRPRTTRSTGNSMAELEDNVPFLP